MKPIINKLIESHICHIGTPNGMRIIIVIGDVKGIIDIHNARELSGWFIITPESAIEKIKGLKQAA